MIILSFALNADIEQWAALMAGMATDRRTAPDQVPLTLIMNGPDAQWDEIETLGERVYQALEYRMNPILWPPEDRDVPTVPIPPAGKSDMHTTEEQ